ncbi:MAG: Fructose-2,6-bisphosphatase [Anaerosolibacter sp.]|jgi:2,3-bisphosphoglycerate-dependent phosphoglycerate mutase|uniref:histidine phosphatase family protein n=1 Tax=Anaerosolibacter sp. TaxID=1872527 RepID=UPI0026074E79|nr:histidine phosphatase family protein [Anaerosolibacter sp.]MDF2545113.1 Fructose-2,6-bisphosphatase [Anaerosolibacter sp.]
MTSIFFIRHAEPDHDWEDDRTRPLTDEGIADSRKIIEFFRNHKIDCYMSSPYKRSIDTIKEIAFEHSIDIIMDERFREREKGLNGSSLEMLQKRWDNFDFHEENGESLNMVQSRNIEAVLEILNNRKGEKIVIGTHGTALSTILNYFDPSYCCNDFLRIIDFMPYIIRLDFDGINYVGKEELLIIQKVFKGRK